MKPGIYYDISIADYHADKGWLSATGLKHAKRSMAELKFYLDGGFDGDYASHFDFGNAFELALLDKQGFESQVAIEQTEHWAQLALEDKPTLKSPKLSSKYKDLANAFELANEGKYFIQDVGKESFDTIASMLESCYRDRVIQALIKNIKYQASLYWIDQKTDLKMKTRPDICTVNKNVVVNLKTDLDASPDQFSRKLANMDYPLQAVTEIIGVESTGLMPEVDKYFWLVVEKVPPYNAQIYEFDKSDVNNMRDEYNFLLSRIKLAKERGLWPGYTDRADNIYGILTARIPTYYGVYNL